MSPEAKDLDKIVPLHEQSERSLMSLDADDLLVFARVIESGSFSRAAERLQLPKSTGSRRIAARTSPISAARALAARRAAVARWTW